MASLKVEKPVGTQLPAGKAKKEPTAAKVSNSGAPKTTRQAAKKAEQKPREVKKKASGGKAAAAKN